PRSDIFYALDYRNHTWLYGPSDAVFASGIGTNTTFRIGQRDSFQCAAESIALVLKWNRQLDDDVVFDLAFNPMQIFELDVVRTRGRSHATHTMPLAIPPSIGMGIGGGAAIIG